METTTTNSNATAHAHGMAERYKHDLAQAVRALNERREGAGNQLLRLLVENNAVEMDVSVALAITTGFKALVKVNDEEIAAMDGRGKVDRRLLASQGMCRIEFAKFLTHTGALQAAHEELDEAGDVIARLLTPGNGGDDGALGLAMELGRMKDLVQAKMAEQVASAAREAGVDVYAKGE